MNNQIRIGPQQQQPNQQPVNGYRRTSTKNDNLQRKYLNSLRRLRHDYLMFMKDPVPYVYVAPMPGDMFEWHYVLRGPENSIYQGGYYHGKLVFPADFPFKPPSIYMITPSGRFKTNCRLCLSFSDFHPDSWNPTWSLSTILNGLLSFMLEEHEAVGSILASDNERRLLAKKSLIFNYRDAVFKELFPNLYEEIKTEMEATKDNDATRSQSNQGTVKNRISGIQQNDNTSVEHFNNQSLFDSVINHLIGLAVLVIFIFIVQLVLTNLN